MKNMTSLVLLLSTLPGSRAYSRPDSYSLLHDKRDVMSEIGEVRDVTETDVSSPKMLWMSGLSAHPDCPEKLDEYLRDYKVAISSWKELNSHAFEPYLVVHVPEDMELEDSPRAADFEWIRSQGGNVVKHTLSFFDLLESYWPDDSNDSIKCLAGAFLRWDFPEMAAQIQIKNPSRFKDTILYTDTDVMWWSRVDRKQLYDIASSNQGNAVSYSTEQDHDNVTACNTGVMFMQVSKFRALKNELLDFCTERNFTGEAMDQGLFNDFFAEHDSSRTYLSEEWNYKVYWGKSSQTGPKPEMFLMHFHGPKPGDHLECLTGLECPDLPGPYVHLRDMGFKNDKGMLAAQVWEQFNAYESEADPHRLKGSGSHDNEIETRDRVREWLRDNRVHRD